MEKAILAGGWTLIHFVVELGFTSKVFVDDATLWRMQEANDCSAGVYVLQESEGGVLTIEWRQSAYLENLTAHVLFWITTLAWAIHQNRLQTLVEFGIAKEDIHELAENDPSQSAIPVLFQIPFDCRPTDPFDKENEIAWIMEVTAKTPGRDYEESFEVPVFKTLDSDPNFVADRSLIADYVAPDDPERDLQEAGVVETLKT